MVQENEPGRMGRLCPPIGDRTSIVVSRVGWAAPAHQSEHLSSSDAATVGTRCPPYDANPIFHLGYRLI